MDELRLQLSQYNDLYLLHQAAFKMSDYTPEARQAYTRELLSRRFDERVVEEHRRKFLRVGHADIECPLCQVDVALDNSDLIRGRFDCPSCKAPGQILVYKSTWYREIPDTVGEVPSLTHVEKESKVPFKSDPELAAILRALETRLSSMDNQALLKILAFEMSSYLKEAAILISDFSHTRQISETMIHEYRDQHLLRDIIFETDCAFCEAPIKIDRKTAVIGSFICGRCDNSQPVVYEQHWYGN